MLIWGQVDTSVRVALAGIADWSPAQHLLPTATGPSLVVGATTTLSKLLALVEAASTATPSSKLVGQVVVFLRMLARV